MQRDVAILLVDTFGLFSGGKMKVTIETATTSFIEKRVKYISGVDEQAARNLLIGNANYSLKNQMGEVFFQDRPENERLELAIYESITAYSGSKHTALKIYREYIKHLDEIFDADIASIDLPENLPTTQTERIIYMAKYFHDKENKRSDLRYKLFVSEQTISADLTKLRGEDSEPVTVCGREFIVKDATAGGGRVSFESTPHPVFLPMNLSEVIVMLESLRQMCDDPIHSRTALRLANDIWGELSDYAKDVIRNRAHDGVSPEPLWYETLGKEDIGTFRTEREARSETGRDNIGYCCKLRKACRIIYTDKDEENICEKVLIKDIRRGIVTIERDGSDFTVDVESIISCVPLE